MERAGCIGTRWTLPAAPNWTAPIKSNLNPPFFPDPLFLCRPAFCHLVEARSFFFGESNQPGIKQQKKIQRLALRALLSLHTPKNKKRVEKQKGLKGFVIMSGFQVLKNNPKNMQSALSLSRGHRGHATSSNSSILTSFIVAPVNSALSRRPILLFSLAFPLFFYLEKMNEKRGAGTSYNAPQRLWSGVINSLLALLLLLLLIFNFYNYILYF